MLGARAAGDGTHRSPAGVGGAKPAHTRSVAAITLSWLAYSDKLVDGSHRQFQTSEFSYQKVTAVASDC